MGQSARILVVDDDRVQLDALAAILDHAGYANVVCTTDSSEVLGLCAETSPDLVMLDLDMPDPDGFQVMEMLRPWIEGRSFPVVALADNGSSEVRRRAIAAGAQELVSKPPDPETMLLRIRNMLELRFLRRELRRHSLLLEQEVENRALDDRKARLEILQRLAVAAEFRDDESGEHGERVGRTSALIGQGLGFPQDQVEMLRFAAPLHDIGKLARARRRPAQEREKLTSEEFELVKRHVTIGRMLLGGTDLPILRMAEQIAVYHHEWWDGTGYAERLAGEKIPLVARIVAVADAFDALTHERPFKGALAAGEALEEIPPRPAGSSTRRSCARSSASTTSRCSSVERFRSGLALGDRSSGGPATLSVRRAGSPDRPHAARADLLDLLVPARDRGRVHEDRPAVEGLEGEWPALVGHERLEHLLAALADPERLVATDELDHRRHGRFFAGAAPTPAAEVFYGGKMP